MILLANIFEVGAALLVPPAQWSVLSLRLLRERSLQKRLQSLENQALLDKARNEAEIIKRDASQEALQFRDQIEKSFADRRAERAESERRLGEREDR